MGNLLLTTPERRRSRLWPIALAASPPHGRIHGNRVHAGDRRERRTGAANRCRFWRWGAVATPFRRPGPEQGAAALRDDRDNFLKGRQSENQGLGVGAFAYYRRVVENHKNEIFDEIIKVCETVGAPQPLIEELGRAKKEISFTKAMGQIKTALPQGLLISGQNPLLALHNALSIGLHNESDAKCLEAAHDVRLVLTDLIERMSLLRRDKSELALYSG